MYPVRNDAQKEELGFSEDKLYHLSPDEELNTLPGVIDHTKYPVIERYNREASMSDFNFWSTWKDEFIKEFKKPTFFEALPETARKVEKGARSLWESVSKSFREREVATRKTKPIEEKPQWGLEESKRVSLIEKGKEFIETFKFKY